MAIPDMEAMDTEWRAWRSVCVELEKVCGYEQEWTVLADGRVDLNDPAFDPLVKAVRRWGEELSELRRSQDGPTRVKALIEHRSAYPDLADE